MITESIPRSESYTFIGGMILGSIGLDNIKWFLSTRSSKEPYRDLIAEKFDRDYEHLFSILESLYNTRSIKTAKYLTKKLCNVLITHNKRKDKSF